MALGSLGSRIYFKRPGARDGEAGIRKPGSGSSSRFPMGWQQEKQSKDGGGPIQTFFKPRLLPAFPNLLPAAPIHLYALKNICDSTPSNLPARYGESPRS